jgi:hypothetical protein
MTARPRRTTNRAGWQLIELSFVLGAFALISVTATRLIVGLMTIERSAGREVQEGAILNRLAQQWREDLHRASSATVSNDDASLQLDLTAGKHVEYRINGDQLTREQRDQTRRTPARESYSVTARKWRFDRSEEGQIITLVCESPPPAIIRSGGSAAPSRVDSIEGAIGILATPSNGRTPEGASP